MDRLRLSIMALVAGLLCVSMTQPVQAQVAMGFGYGGYGYGAHQYSGYYAGNYVGYPYSNWYISPSYGLGYTRSYGVGALGYGPSYGIAGPVIVTPNPIYGTSTTIIRGGPTGGVVQYTHNGNGYTYVPDSTYPTLVLQQPTLGLSRTVVPPTAPPVVVESRPQGSNYGVSGGSPTVASQFTNRSGATIKLVCPKTAGGPLSYSLNGHVYSIQPGYVQTFRDDRPWTLQFKRGGEGSEIASYPLQAGTYTFAVGANGWELQQPGAVTEGLPPAPLPDPPPSAPSTTPSLPPSPLPPP